MELQVRQTTENPVMNRYELEICLEHEGEATPSQDDVKSRLAAEENLDSGDINVRSINGRFGNQNSIADVHVNGDAEFESLEAESPGRDYTELLEDSVSEAKDALEELEDPDWDAVLKAEKEGKNRKTLKQWIENNIE